MTGEAGEQEKVFIWAEYQRSKYPELKMLYAIPNGGYRNKIEAANLKKQGVKAGVPDIYLSVPKGIYHGLYIEMKYGKNKPTAKQKQWLENLSEYGYKTAVCYSWETAVAEIKNYLGV